MENEVMVKPEPVRLVDDEKAVRLLLQAQRVVMSEPEWMLGNEAQEGAMESSPVPSPLHDIKTELITDDDSNCDTALSDPGSEENICPADAFLIQEFSEECDEEVKTEIDIVENSVLTSEFIPSDPNSSDTAGQNDLLKSNESTSTLQRKIPPGRKEYECELCSKIFYYSNDLTKHRRVHTGDKPFKCDVCNKSFSTSSYLVIHKKIHTGEKPFKCKECGKSFTQSGAHLIHSRTHTGEKPFKCQVCNKVFSSSSNLITHTNRHTGEKPIKCDVCGRGFTNSSDVARHRKTHTGERPYKCQTCNQFFSTSTNLKKHSKKHVV